MSKVSVIIPCYNASKFIVDSVDSILYQNIDKSTEIEIIVVNDGSTDNSLQILKRNYSNNKFVKIINKQHSGIVRTINRGLIEANGDFIALQGADDVSYPDRLKVQLDMLNNSNNVVLVYSDLTMINEEGAVICKSYWEKYNVNPHRGKPIKELFKDSFVSGGTIMFKRNLLNKIFPIPTILPYEDYWIAFIAALYYEIDYCDRPLIMYRKHSNNTNLDAERKSYIKKFKKKIDAWLYRGLFYKEYLKFSIDKRLGRVNYID